jgi:hypothetical protein
MAADRSLSVLVFALVLPLGCAATDDESLGALPFDGPPSIEETEIDSLDATLDATNVVDAGSALEPLNPIDAADASAAAARDAEAGADGGQRDASLDAGRALGPSLECIFEPWECP